MNVVIDMNLSPLWEGFLRGHGHEALHWSQLGAATAGDHEILEWARANSAVVLTNDLDFGDVLAATGQDSPSVVQLRMNDLLPDAAGPTVLNALHQFEGELSAGALISVDARRHRARILPITRQS